MMVMNKDKYGIIGQIQSDGSMEGGDSVNWMGHYVYLTDDTFPFLYTFEISPGAYVRHPDPDQTTNGFGSFYKNPWNGCISRDQMTGILAALIKKKQYLASLRLILHHSLRGFLFAYNNIHNGEDSKTAKWKIPDPTGPDIWAMEIRSLGIFSKLLYPVLMLCDLHLLGATLYYKNKDQKDPISHAMKHIVSKNHTPTIISKLSWKLLNKKKLIREIENYWCGWRDNCEMSKLYEKELLG